MLHFIPLRFIKDNSFAGFKRKMIREILLERNLQNPTLPGILLARSSNSSGVKKTQHKYHLLRILWFAGFLKMRLDFTFQRILLNGCFWWTTRDQWLQTLASSNSGDESQNIKSWCWRLFLGIGIVQWLCFSRSTTGKQFRNKVTRNQSLKCYLLQEYILIKFKSFVGLWSSIRKVIGKNPLECKVKSHFEETCKSQNSQFRYRYLCCVFFMLCELENLVRRLPEKVGY